MIRIIHRIAAVLAVLPMLWLAGTGTGMQLLDFKSILSHDPPTNPTQLSITDGLYGPGFFVVLQMSDFTAAAFPRAFDIEKGMETVLQAARAPQQQNVSWIEMRVTDGIPVGRIMSGTALEAFNAQTGEPVTAVPDKQIPQGGSLPYSLRQELKILHRLRNRGDVPGVYFELLAGLVVFTFLITGLIMYFKLLLMRAKTGRKQWFWLAGGVWRGLHRSVSVLSAVFLIFIAFTGTFLGFDNSWSALHGYVGEKLRSSPVHLEDVPAMTATTLEAMQRLHPDTPIKAIRLRNFGQMKQAVVISGGEKTDQLLFDAANGQQVSLTEPSYPKSNFLFGFQMHENFVHMHIGDMFGIPVRLMNLFAGLSLLFLSLSGIVMYFDMWSQRSKRGRKSLFWTR